MDNSRVTHCLSIDVDGFVESMVESFAIPDRYSGSEKDSHEIEVNVDVSLELIGNLGIKATFFILGRIARDRPEVVRKIASNGHEIACHSLYHRRVSAQTPDEFKKDVQEAKHLLEGVGGQEVFGFRAPDFSITPEAMWALDILTEVGFRYDSSMVPTDIHDVYGNPGSERGIHRLPCGLWEFPASTFSLFGHVIPFGGGGYMRLYPVWYTRRLMRQREAKNESCMLYMHPYELGPEAPRIAGISLYRKYRHYHNISRGSRKTERVVAGFQFDTAISILNEAESRI